VIHKIINRQNLTLLFSLWGLLVFSAIQPLSAQSTTAAISGTITDSKSGVLQTASIDVKQESTGNVRSVKSDAQGHFSLNGFAPGRYTVEISAPGFGVQRRTVQLTGGQDQDLSVALNIGDISQQVTVEANSVGSIAAALAPMDALLETMSARTIITQAYIQNFTSPVADYGEVIAMAPGTFTLNGNGVGLGQSKTYFRGFPDGYYNVDFDGIPFYDTNSPTHHSWAFFPSQFLGGVDFDRSPGTASTIGPTPFGGSIHLLSKELSPVQSVRGQFAYGSFNTYLYDGQYDSGNILPNHKLNFELDVHHMQSDGYQTFNHQTRNAGDIKVQYRFSDKTVLTGFSGVIWLDANTPNFSATRCQMYGATSAYACTGTLAPFAGTGLNFLLTDNSDPVNYLNNQYNYYHVPTDFEYVGVHSELGHNFTLDVKPYTYNYDNSEKFSNVTPITYSTTINGSKTYNGLTIAPCNVPVVKKGVSAIPCGVDKYNSYRKYGETSQLSQVSKLGIFRTGVWYEWAKTNRHQYPSDPLNNWADQTLPNFAEQFWNNSLQPYAEFEFHATQKLNITPGVKFAYFTIDTKQYADNGKTIGNLCNTLVTPNVCVPYVSNYGSYSAWLPSGSANYRLRNNWSVYGQISTGSIVPPSSVYDFNQTISKTNPTPGLGVAPKQQRSTTYQFGTVLKMKRFTFDADYYRIRFQNSYSAVTDPVTGEQDNFLQPSSITKGFEAESNIYFGYGLNAYLNATVGRATYTGTLASSCVIGTTGCTSSTPQLIQTAPSGLWVSQTPSDTEAVGVSYQKKSWDLGIFNKRVGTFYQDNGSYHNQVTINPFNVTNAYFNYTIRSGGRFDQTKLRLSFNNLFDEHSVTGITPVGAVNTQTISANGATYTDLFNTVGQTPISGGDNVSIIPGRSIMLSVIFGYSPKR
jgi:iron complex outermembrane receptor protein